MLNSKLPELCACPSCNGPLVENTTGFMCQGCKKIYKCQNGFVDFLVGEGFEDIRNEWRAQSEERMDDHTTKNYLLPFLENLRKELGPPDKPLSVLSVGCGVGVDVEILHERGIDVYGIDCGSRIYSWPKRKCRDRLFIGSGKDLPFKTNSFDCVVGFGVIEHIGVVGDTVVAKPTYWEERVRFAQEVTRITKPGGYIMLSCANRLFPFDLLHRPGDRYIPPRFHWYTEPFLLSYGDFQKIFIEETHCRSIQALPPAGYWGYNHLLKIPMGKFLAATMDFYFDALSSKTLSFLRTSFLSPFIVVLIKK